MVLEAYEGHWRQVPAVKRVIMRVPEASTPAMLKRQEADIAFALDGAIAEEVKRTCTSPWWKRGPLRLLDRVSRAGSRPRSGRTSACASR